MVAQNIGSAERRGRGWRSPLAVAATAAIALTGCSVTPKAGAQTEGGAPALGDVADAPVLDGIVNNKIRYGDNLCNDPRIASYVARIVPELSSTPCVFSPDGYEGTAVFKKGRIALGINLDKTGKKDLKRVEEDLKDNPLAEVTRLGKAGDAEAFCFIAEPGTVSSVKILRPDNTSVAIVASYYEGFEEGKKPIDYLGCSGPDKTVNGADDGQAVLTPATKELVEYLAEATRP